MTDSIRFVTRFDIYGACINVTVEKKKFKKRIGRQAWRSQVYVIRYRPNPIIFSGMVNV